MNYVLRSIKDTLHFISPNLDAAFLIVTHCNNATNVDLIAHDSKNDRLIIKYTSGEVYQYNDVSKEVFDTLGEKSIGSWIRLNIKGAYSYQRMTGIIDIRIPTQMEIVLLVDKLQHHHATTVGLWATDRPDLIRDKRGIMFQITE